MKKLHYFILVFLLSTNVWAQERLVSGRVTSAEDGSAIPGVNVVAKGSGTGTATDSDGRYSINVPSGSGSLIFSFIGLQLQEVSIGDRTIVDVAMAADITQLSEVVVVGYGTQERRSITGAIAKANGKEILENIPVADPLQGLQGRVAGVQVTSGSGRPGQAQIVRVRGVASIGAAGSNDPLYVVDGVIISNRDDSRQAGTPNAGQGISPLASLNPEDIQSIEILKDASAAAIYGSRASNGVVLITTKRGSYGAKTELNFSAYQGLQSLSNRLDFLDARQYREIQREARANAGNPVDPQFADDPSIISTNWLDLILRNQSRISNYQLSAAGGNERTRFYVSLGYFTQEAILLKGDFKRISGRINLDHKATEKLTFGLNLQFAKSSSIQTPVDNSIYSPWARSLDGRPDEKVYNDNGTFAINTFNNAVQMFEPDQTTDIFSSIGNFYAEYEIIKHLVFRSSIGASVAYTKDFSYFPTTHPSGLGVDGDGTAGNALGTNWLTENTLTYNRKFLNNKLSASALLGYTFQEDNRERSYVSGRGYPSDFFKYITSAADIYSGSSDWTGNSIESYLSRINLDYDGKYLLSMAIRRDGSSKFGVNNRYGTFPSISAGWRISAENFMSGVNVVDDLKFRASYGKTGNQASIGNFTALSLIGSGNNYNDNAGFAGSVIGNPDLTWETTIQTNIGFDLSVLNARLNVAFDYYNKETQDLLLAQPIPRTSGFASIQRNVGSISNKGFELNVRSINVDKKIKWTTDFNIARNINEVTKLANNNTPIDAGFVSRTAVGQSLGSFFLVKALGVDPQTGDMIFEDVDGNGIIGGNDRQFLGSPWPDFVGGLTNTVSYKGFDLSVFFQFSFGNDIYKIYQEGINGTTNLGASLANMTTDVLNRWRAPGDVTDMPRAVTGAQGVFNNQRSSRFLEDASYVRMKNITLGYTIPSSLLGKVGVRSARAYITGQNLLTFTKFSGFDPEAFSSLDDRQLGVDNAAIPQLKNITIGINIGL